MSEPVTVQTDGLRREFGATTALDGVDLDFEGSEVVGVAGPNGCGKTTLIRALLGLLAPTDGEVAVNGSDPTAFSGPERARIGYMPQHEAVYSDLTVAENAAFFARLYGVDDVDGAVADVLDFVDLTHRRDDRVATLSGGMVRRASLACALVHDPDVLFLDEPTVGVDPELRSSMWRDFRRRSDAGAFVLVSTHYLGEARHCDRVLFLRDGEVLALDTPAAVRRRTGADDLEDAFLALLEDTDHQTAANGSGGEGA